MNLENIRGVLQTPIMQVFDFRAVCAFDVYQNTLTIF
jgi:hypothetical protein